MAAKLKPWRRRLRSFLAGCWFGCHHIRERRGRQYVLVCENCGNDSPMLPNLKKQYRDRFKVVEFRGSKEKKRSTG